MYTKFQCSERHSYEMSGMLEDGVSFLEKFICIIFSSPRSCCFFCVCGFRSTII
ncbi:hypothetical protein PAHAL_4G019900 [Panicum hallii]|uniref:Uncharacterized protein n=1 Tax=Panicum hallii TaxID=206008 RepID=A0A2T8JBG6_9POAL|nr:hypothetical protein PAHAL_4G019900 [Panicum hallii]